MGPAEIPTRALAEDSAAAEKAATVSKPLTLRASIAIAWTGLTLQFSMATASAFLKCVLS